MYNRQSENINNPSLLYLAVSIERDLFFKIMKEKFFEWLEFVIYLFTGLVFISTFLFLIHKYY